MVGAGGREEGMLGGVGRGPEALALVHVVELGAGLVHKLPEAESPAGVIGHGRVADQHEARPVRCGWLGGGESAEGDKEEKETGWVAHGMEKGRRSG